MKHLTFLSLLAVGLMLVGGGTGCRKKPVGVTHIPGAQGGKNTFGSPRDLDRQGSVTDPDVFSTETGYSSTQKPMNTGPQDREVLKTETVYFDLDSATVKESEKSKLQRVADYMRANTANDILIEGHCDERGTEGYNLALGERRAQALREHLIEIGASGERIYTVSHGETRPAAEGQGESAWSKNRRGEFVVVLPAN